MTEQEELGAIVVELIGPNTHGGGSIQSITGVLTTASHIIRDLRSQVALYRTASLENWVEIRAELRKRVAELEMAEVLREERAAQAKEAGIDTASPGYMTGFQDGAYMQRILEERSRR